MDIAEFVTEFKHGIDAIYPDLDFLKPHGILSMSAELLGVEQIRIELPGTQYFHLHSISVEGPEITDLRKQATCSLSSHYEKYAETFEENLIFQADLTHGTAFHTNKERNPWLEISFDRPMDISRISLRNIPGHTAWRSRGIRVSVKQRGEWTSVYDGVSRSEDFSKAIDRINLLNACGDASLPVQELRRVLCDLMLTHYTKAAKDLEAISGLDPQDRNDFRKIVSTEILADRSLEWTIHGIRRSFRFWTPREQRRYVAFTVGVTEDLRSLTDKVCFGFGSVLAVVRDGELIKHDDDLDLIVGFEPHEAQTLSDGIQLIRDHLRPLGYTVAGSQLAHQHVSKDGIRSIDVFVGLFEGDDIAWYPGKRGSLTRALMYPTSEASFLGQVCPLPRNPLTYLEKVYGKGWRVPDPGFKHRWGRHRFRDIAGEEEK